MFNKAKLKFEDIFDNKLPEEEVKAYLIELYERGETAGEIAAAADVMREHSIRLPIHENLEEKLIDNCGTGGDKSGSFNVSTTVSIVLASCGCYVAKHGNKSITSKSGSADMLEALGYNIHNDLQHQARMLEEVGFCFMFAVNHHPAMKYIMPIRKSLSHRTIFNILGPLTNPAGANKQLVGVFSKDYVPRIAEALNMLESKKAMVVSSKDGLDEISISDITYASYLKEGETKEFEIDPVELGIKRVPLEAIKGGDAEQNAKITLDLLNAKESNPHTDIVVINAAAALMVDDKARDLIDGIEMAKEAIFSGKAKAKLDDIIKISNQI
jgi:anthranilate phosphoribosyltransferase